MSPVRNFLISILGSNFMDSMRQWMRPMLMRVRLVGVIMMVSLFLTGCIQSDVGIRFDNPNRGEISQQIQIGERLKALNQSEVQLWLRSLEKRASAVGGHTQRDAEQSMSVKIPFNNSEDLEKKFNQFFGEILSQAEIADSNVELPMIRSNLTVIHSNFLLMERNRLRYDIDLRSLGVLSASGDVLISPASLFDLEFKLETPWGARNVLTKTNLRPRSRKGNHELIWTLIPGEDNTIETVFWMPSPLGIGTVMIGLLVLLGYYLKNLARTNPIPGVKKQQPT